MTNRSNVSYVTNLERVEELSPEERERVRPVSERYVFRSNSYYQSLIDWSDPNDPIRRLVIPNESEMSEWGKLDASDEGEYTKVPGLEHKYPDTALLLVNDVCGAYCRFCFRKRLFMKDNEEVVKDVSQGLAYIGQHKEITNVLMTGGDPLIMSTPKLEKVISRIREISHVQIIRIGSKMPAFNPFRITDDPSLPKMLSEYSTAQKRIYVMAHFNHPVELTEAALKGLDHLIRAGVIVVNQTPLIRGINDTPEVLHKLFNNLSYAGVPPYYVFQCRPTAGNREYSVPVEESFAIFEEARTRSSGLAKRARFAMSHRTGKVEVLAVQSGQILLRYHRAAKKEDEGRVFSLESNPDAYWLDEYLDYDAESSSGAQLISSIA